MAAKSKGDKARVKAARQRRAARQGDKQHVERNQQGLGVPQGQALTPPPHDERASTGSSTLSRLTSLRTG